MKLLELIINFIPLTGNALADYILSGVLLVITGSVAYTIGSKLGYSGKIGGILWIFTALIIYKVLSLIVRFMAWLITIPWWIWAVVLAIITAVLVTYFIIRKNKSNDKQKQSTQQGEEK